MTKPDGGWTAAMAAVIGITTVSAAFADANVVNVTVPAHTEWCSKSTFDVSLFQSAVGHDSAMTEGATPILSAAFKAGAKRIGHVYIHAFQPDDKQVVATFCAGVPSSLQTDDASITVEEVPAAQVLGAVCADPDECMADIAAVLKDKPYSLTQDQIDLLDWHYAPTAMSDSTADVIAAGLVETDSTLIAEKTDNDQAQGGHLFTIVAVPKPAQ